ncbi:MAG: aromatic amino acid ammonia-lyase [Elusimicrobiota bacterium]
MIMIDADIPLTLESFAAACAPKARFQLSPKAGKRVATSYTDLLGFLANDARVYGIGTGFGTLQSESIPRHRWVENQLRLVESHACGVGEPLDPASVRGAMYLRARQLTKGFSGVSPHALAAYISALNKGALPTVPSQGSVGACGDLLPLAHIAKKILPTVPRAKIGPRDGLALINGTEVSTAVTLASLARAARLLANAHPCVALSLKAVSGKTEAWAEAIIALKKHPHSIQVARVLSALAGDDRTIGLPQDPYSFRAAPQILGAASELFSKAVDMALREAASATDNPAFITRQGVVKAYHGANFHGIYNAVAADMAAWALQLAALTSERRAHFMLSGERGLPPMLTQKDGHSHWMMLQTMQAALVSENKILTHPASADSVPTNNHQEDVVPMAMHAAMKLTQVLNNTSHIFAAEAIIACAALGHNDKRKTLGAKLRAFADTILAISDPRQPAASLKKAAALFT